MTSTTSTIRSHPHRRRLGPVQLGRPWGRVAPGPTGSRLSGCLAEMRRDELGFMVAAANEHGDVVRFELGPRPAHVTAHLIRHPDHIHHVLLAARDNYPKAFTYQLLRRVLGNGLVTSDDELWSRQRRTIQPVFRHSRVLELGQHMTSATEDLLRRWEARADGEPVDAAAEMMRLTLDIVGRALFSDDLTDEAAVVGPAVGVLLRDVVERSMSPLGLLTLIAPQIPTPTGRRVQDALATLDRTVNRIVARRASQDEAERPLDLLTLLLSARDQDTGQAMSREQVRDEVMTFLIAGHETTANALTWSLYLLSLHPLAARRLRDELSRALSGRAATAEDVRELVYTQAVVREAMRLYPPVVAIERDVREDDEIGGFDIPAGSTVIISPWVSHRNPRFWSAPEAFDPDRFLRDPNAATLPSSYLPFGGGPRQCIGSGFALQEAVIALATIVARFRLELVSGQVVEPQVGVTLRPRHGLPMTLHHDPVPT